MKNYTSSPAPDMINTPQELQPRRQLKFYTLIAMLFVSLAIITNIVAQKVVPLGSHLILTAGDFTYPLNYLFSMILTEVYGYAMSRRVIWAAFFCNVVVILIMVFAVVLPAAAAWHDQAAYALVLGRAPRLLLASLGAFWCGEFVGSYILAKIKVNTLGRYLWLRSMAATLAGQLIDSVLFTTIAFGGVVSWQDVLTLSLVAYGCKIIYQLLLTPVIYLLAQYLKRREQVDIFDVNTNFNPFHLGLE